MATASTASAPAAARAKTERAASDGWAEDAGRAGAATRGLLYLIVAWLAVAVARGHSRQADSKGALMTIAHQPIGRVLVCAVAAGLAAFAVWSAIGVVVGDGAKKLSLLGRAAVYAGLCAFALSLVVGHARHSGEQESDLAARVLRLPAGRWIVGAIGIGIIVGGLVTIRKAFGGRWVTYLQRPPANPRTRTVVGVIATVGMLARTSVFVLIGAFVVRAAWRYNPGDAVGVDGALKRVAGAPHGPLLLVLVAAGLVAYAVWCEVMAVSGPSPGA